MFTFQLTFYASVLSYLSLDLLCFSFYFHISSGSCKKNLAIVAQKSKDFWEQRVKIKIFIF
jgi:hypothetical protein